VKQFGASLPANIEVRTAIKTENDVVMAHPTQLHQVLMNLCTNAAHAMRGREGMLGVTLERVTVGAAEAPRLHHIGPGDYVRLTVTDTGVGMDAKTMGRIFEPFFTTKPPGEGTGMGLSVVHGIVEAHHGEVTVESAPGQGATFRVYIPAAKAGPRAADPAGTAEPLPCGSESVLIVDDEQTLAEMAGALLGELGYRVRGFTDSREALQVYLAAPATFDLVLTDQTMPHVTGLQLTQRCLAVRPEQAVILCTGYSEEINIERIRAAGIADLLMKPYTQAALARAVRTVLDAARARTPDTVAGAGA